MKTSRPWELELQLTKCLRNFFFPFLFPLMQQILTLPNLQNRSCWTSEVGNMKCCARIWPTSQVGCFKLFYIKQYWHKDLFWNECFLINDLCTTFSGHFFAICMFIFHKTEALTVILRCLTVQFKVGSKVMTQNANISISFFFAILYKNRYLHLFCFLCFCVFCHNLCTN